MEAGGELCFLSLPCENKRLSCNENGGLSLSDNWKSWEVWRFIETGKDNRVLISSWVHRGYFLSCSPDGRVSTSKNQLGWEEWIVEKEPGRGGVLIKSAAHGLFMGKSGNKIFATNNVPAINFLWKPEAAHRSLYNMLSQLEDRQLTVNQDSPNKLQLCQNKGHSEKWKIEIVDGNLTLFSVTNNSYVGCDNVNGDISFSSDCGTGYYWKLQDGEDGYVYLVSSEKSWYLALFGKESVKTVQMPATATGAYQTLKWKLVPCVPQVTAAITKKASATKTDNQDWNKLLIIGATAGLCAVAAPFAVMGVVGALGFGAQGIAAGSIAAGMMSAEAIAAGGGVVAGGTVATLQSIGAAGLGVWGTTAAVGTGAVAGGLTSVAATTILTKSGSDSSGNIKFGDTKLENSLTNRPFCAWETW
jgi:hypothetical protein